MAIEYGIWKIDQDNKPIRLTMEGFDYENRLEKIILTDISILNPDWLIIGNQVSTDTNKKIDILAIDSNANLIIIELKKGKTPRNVVAQGLDYASWAKNLTLEELQNIHKNFNPDSNLNSEFQNKFGIDIDDKEKIAKINNLQKIVIVSTELDESTERIIKYLNENLNRPLINVLFFNVFIDNENTYFSRAWLTEPKKFEDDLIASNENINSWNGEVYCNFGASINGRNWEDAINYEFVAGGGGVWYSRTLRTLKEGERIWVKIPQSGYVGVGIVASSPMKIAQFFKDKGIHFEENSNHCDTNKILKGKYNTDDDEESDYAVKVKWLKTVTEDQAISKPGLFGNQNTVARPVASAWQTTIDFLKTAFKIEE